MPTVPTNSRADDRKGALERNCHGFNQKTLTPIEDKTNLCLGLDSFRFCMPVRGKRPFLEIERNCRFYEHK